MNTINQMITRLQSSHAKNWLVLIAIVFFASLVITRSDAQSIIKYHPDGEICVNSEVTFQYSGTCDGAYLSWFFEGEGNGQIISTNASEKKVTVKWTSTTTMARLVAYCNIDPNQTASTDYLTIYGALGQVSAPSGTTKRCQGSGTSSYTAYADNAASYSWGISPTGAGSISSSGVVTWSSSFYGTATIGVTAYGCQYSYSNNSTSVVVDPPSEVEVTISDPGPICSNQAGSVAFHVTSLTNGGTSPVYTWFRGTSGTTIADDNESGTPETYSPSNPVQDGEIIRCEVTSNAYCVANPGSSNSVNIEIEQAVTPTVSIYVPNPTICEGSTATFTASSPQTITSYAWSIGESSTLSTESSFTPSASYLPVPGRYVYLTVGVSGTCINSNTASSSLYETVDPQSQVGTLSSNPSEFCSSGTVNLGLSSYLGSLNWLVRSKDGEGTWGNWASFSTNNATSNTFNVTSGSSVPRYYEFQVTATSGVCAPAYSNITGVTAYPTSAIGTVEVTNGTEFCSSATVNLSLSSYTGSLSWKYRYKDGANGTFGDWTIFSTAETTSNSTPTLSSGSSYERIYEIVVEAKSGTCNLIESNTKTVKIYPKPSVSNVSVSPGTEVYGSVSPSLTLSVSSSVGTVSYESSIDGTQWFAVSNPTTISQTTQFSAKASSGVCTPAYSPSPVAVILYPFPVITVTAGPVYLSYGNTAQLSTGNYYSYQWTKDGNDISGANAQNVIISEPGVYSVKVKGSATAPEASAEAVTIYDAIRSQTDQNYISTVTFLKEGISNTTSLFSLTSSDYSQSTTYFDGLGRPMQTVTTMGSPQKRDMVQPVAYDSFGREHRKYLPFVAAENTGRYKQAVIDPLTGDYQNAALNFYNNGTGDAIADDAYPYAETIFEPSPLNRILETGSAGAVWQPNKSSYASPTDRAIHFAYESNMVDEVLLWRDIRRGGDTLSLVNATSGDTIIYYDANSLSKIKRKDEHYNEVIAYVDKQGRTILKKAQVDATTYAQTYYIYDDFSNLVCVLPPEAVKNILASPSEFFGKTDAEKETFLARWAFRYKYDARKRIIIKQVPGAYPVYMVYDNRDRLVLTQDGNQRATSPYYWTFTKYDELNRPILTGIKDTAEFLSQAEMQRVVNYHYSKIGAQWGEEYGTTEPIHGYSNKTYPIYTSGGIVDPNHYLTVTYYDNYEFRNQWLDTYTYADEGLSETVNEVVYQQPLTESSRVMGQITGSKIKVLDGGVRGRYTWLNSVSYYDEKYRQIQSISDNYKGGKDKTTNLYDFTGKVLKTKVTHTTHEISWKELVNTVVVGNNLIKTALGAGWSAGGVTVEQLPAGADGWIECVISEANQKRAFGLTATNEGEHRNTIDYAFWHDATAAAIFENGSMIYQLPGPVNSGDVIRIERIGSSMKYYSNGVLLHTTENASTGALIGDASIDSGSGNILVPRASFNAQADSIMRRFVYDHAGRLTEVWHQINTAPEIRITYNEYNELGQLIDKKLHSTDQSASNAVQSIDYAYNIRGWLTDMNKDNLSNGDASDPVDYFSFQLGYNNPIGTANDALYNGNISGMKWSTNLGLDEEKMKAYNYSYDKMNRITAATFKTGTGNAESLTWQSTADNSFSESGYSYDLNGNIKGLTRKGKNGTDLDILTYDYGTGATQTNQLLKVSDAGSKTEGFTEIVGEGNDYKYDNNGNLVWDKNKGGEEVLQNGEFTDGSMAWIVSDTGGRLTFAEDSLKVTPHATASATIRQDDIILTRATYVIIVDMVRVSGSITFNIGFGGNKSVSASGKTVFTYTAGSGNDFVLTIPTGFSGRINSIEVKGVVVISYNFLNLPEKVVKGLQQSLAYIYDATGRKHSQEVYSEAGLIIKKSDYEGEFFYENDTLKFITHDEGRVVLKDSSPEYQYHLKDHLGNTRLTFTTKSQREEFTATLETGTQEEETNTFKNYHRVDWDLFDHTDATGTVYTYSQLLHAGNNSQVGLGKSFSIMPGDTIKAEVYAKYQNLTSNTSGLSEFATALTGAFGLNSTMTGDPGSAYDALNAYGTIIADGYDHSEDVNGPKAYLNILLFDRDYNLIDAAYKQIGVNDIQGADPLVKDPHGYLNREVIVTVPGYAYIFLSNENPTQVDVYFDDLKITHSKSPVIQMDDYYPFGLSFNSYARENSVPNRYKYNGIEQATDLDLNIYTAKYRNLDPTTGRWWQLDPKPNFSWSSYSSMSNNPMRYSDPLGDTVVIHHRKQSYVYENGKLSQNGQAYTGKVKGFLKQSVKALDKVRTGGAEGQKLVGELQSNAATTNIMKGSNGFIESGDKSGLTNVVRWSPGNGSGGPNESGGTSRPSFIGLGHELAHSYDKVTDGKVNYAPWAGVTGAAKAEIFATHVENMLRAENQIPLRTHYGINNSSGSPVYEGQLIYPGTRYSTNFNQYIPEIDEWIPHEYQK
jgi:RHS repeat-associated protein